MKLLFNYYNVYKYLQKNHFNNENIQFNNIQELYNIVDSNLYLIQKTKPDIYKYLNTENIQINAEYLNNPEIKKFITYNIDNIINYTTNIHHTEIKKKNSREDEKDGEDGEEKDEEEDEEEEEEEEEEEVVEGGFIYNKSKQKSNKKSKKSKQQLRINSSRKKY